ncbi:MAG: PAS domain-containing protein, partial [Actinomycetota bacterium]|nr:PAS domain-containing protein [Actinomycetota bacterium]
MPNNTSERRCYSHIRALLAGTSEGMIAIAPNRRVRVLNERAAEILGLGRDTIVGAEIPADRFPGLVVAIDSAIADGTTATWIMERDSLDYTCIVSPYD